MNNQSSVGEQLLQLQNIAYMKQFMQKASVKILFLVSYPIIIINVHKGQKSYPLNQLVNR